MELTDYSAYEIRQLLLNRKVSAVEIARAFLERIRQVDGRPRYTGLWQNKRG